MQVIVSNSTTKEKETFRIYRWALSYLMPYKWQLCLFIFCGVIIGFSELAVPKFIQTFIDLILPSANVKLFIWIFIGLLVLLSIMFAARAAQNVLERKLSEYAARDIQYDIFRHLRLLGFSYYERHPVGDTLSLLNTEVAAVQQLYRFYIPDMLPRFILLLVALGFLISTDIWLSLLILPFFGSYYLFGPGFEKKFALLGKETTRLQSAFGKKVYDGISSLLELRVFGREEWDLKRFLDAQVALYRNFVLQFRNNYIRISIRNITVWFGLVAIIWVGAELIRRDKLSVGELVAFTVYYSIFMNNLMALMRNFTEQRVILYQAEGLFHFMQRVPDVIEPQHPERLDSIRGELKFDDVSFGYTHSSQIIKGFDLTVHQGERVALVGSSGSGKTTMLKLVGRFYDPDSGRITLDGVPLNRLSFEQLRGAIGYVFQESYMFGYSVRENIRFGDPSATDEEVEAAAKMANAHDFIMKFPKGYETMVGERGIKLSGGQKQRIAIARTFLKQPRILLLDEATSALDNVSEREVQKALETLLEGRTTITVAHRLSTIRNYDRIAYMENGAVKELGTYEELLSLRGGFYELAQHMEQDRFRSEVSQ